MILTSPLSGGSKVGQPLLRFEKGEVIPVLALSFDKTGPHQYVLRLPARFDGPKGEASRKRLEKALEGLSSLQMRWKGSELSLHYQGPDTPLLKALAGPTFDD